MQLWKVLTVRGGADVIVGEDRVHTTARGYGQDQKRGRSDFIASGLYERSTDQIPGLALLAYYKSLLQSRTDNMPLCHPRSCLIQGVLMSSRLCSHRIRL